MKIVGCDLHARYQQIAMLDEETGELIERRLEHANGEAKELYTKLARPVRVGIEATGHTRWFERLLAELGHELWVGDAAPADAAPYLRMTGYTEAIQLCLQGRKIKRFEIGSRAVRFDPVSIRFFFGKKL